MQYDDLGNHFSSQYKIIQGRNSNTLSIGLAPLLVLGSPGRKYNRELGPRLP